MAETASKQIEEAGGIEEIRQRLEEKREEIVEMYEQDLRAGQEAIDEGGADDIVDRATRASSRELLFSLSDSERQTLLQIEEALERVEGGQYGVCVHCDEPIAAARLKAVPWARYCIDCQELAERDALD